MEPMGNFNLRIFYASDLKYGFFIHKSDQRCFMNNSPQSLFSKDKVLFCLFLPSGAIVWNKLSLSVHIINQTNVGLILCLFISYIISDTIFISFLLMKQSTRPMSPVSLVALSH